MEPDQQKAFRENAEQIDQQKALRENAAVLKHFSYYLLSWECSTQ